MQAILKGIKSFGKSNFHEQIELSREDEWDTIEKALNNMATDLSQSYTALGESEERFRDLAEMLPEAVFETNLNLELTYANRRAFELLGYSVEDLKRRLNGLEMLSPEDRDRAKANIAMRLKGEDPGTVEYQALRKDGSSFPILFHANAIIKEGELFGFRGIIIDITARKRAEEALHKRAREFAALYETSLEITKTHDLSTLLETIIERAAQLLNCSSGGMYLCDPDRKEVRCVVSYKTSQDHTGIVLKYGEGAAGIVAQTGEPLIIDDYRTWSKRASVFEKEHPFYSVISVPMIWQDDVIGVIHALNYEETRSFTQSDLDLLTLFASQATTAVNNTRLVEQIQSHTVELRKRVIEVEEQTTELEKVNEQLKKEIKERKLAEESVRESRERYRAIFDQAADSIVVIDGETEALVEFNENPTLDKKLGKEYLTKFLMLVVSSLKCNNWTR